MNLLLSPLDRSRQDAPGRHYLAPTQENVERILFKELLACPAWTWHAYRQGAPVVR
ncbi:hypothetical protein [Streptomyces coffeae]|uniref:Uncharacterized protein n=1 Tax=Streptomyces coffeae TaxID=621382 RepID=A0ABS1NC73_9ACTN|nr:hypothetical protein [Streptomyces coffeae]MBL1097658.1 hypothetical protein [Streptomyces coffeae]